MRASDPLLLHFTAHGTADPPIVVSAEGLEVIDTEGNRHLDGLSSLFCAQLGYGHKEEMAQVAREQIETLPFHTNWNTAHTGAMELAERVTALAPSNINHAYFTSGGSESVETAYKLAVQYHVANGQPERRTVIARDLAYHGVTLGALAMTGVARFKDPFGPPALSVRHVSHTNLFRSGETEEELNARLLAELEATILEEGPETVAMVIAEPLQNAGGAFTPPEGYWAGLRDICDRHGVLLVADEVITGFGRLGEWFGVQRYGAAPDMITTAKGLTAAYAPMGAVLVSDKVAEPLYREGVTLLHGITFGGHPLAAALALRSLEIFEREGVLENVRAREPELRESLEALRELPIVGDVRGAGFFWALELTPDGGEGRFDAATVHELVKRYVPQRLREARLIARPDDRGDAVLHFSPPLVSDRATLDEMVSRIGDVLADAGKHVGARRAAAVASR